MSRNTSYVLTGYTDQRGCKGLPRSGHKSCYPEGNNGTRHSQMLSSNLNSLFLSQVLIPVQGVQYGKYFCNISTRKRPLSITTCSSFSSSPKIQNIIRTRRSSIPIVSQVKKHKNEMRWRGCHSVMVLIFVFLDLSLSRLHISRS